MSQALLDYTDFPKIYTPDEVSFFKKQTMWPVALSGATVSMLHFDGNLTDLCGKTWTAVSGAGASTSQKKFGSGSCYFGGTDDYIYTANNEDFNFGTGDFTIDYWVYDSTTNLDNSCHFYKGPSSGGHYPYIWGSVGGVYASNGGGYVLTQNLSLTASTWTHIAITRASGVLRVFKNGTLLNTGGTAYTTDMSTNYNFCIGGGVTTQYMVGYIDEFRICKGLAAWTANFTPPTSAY